MSTVHLLLISLGPVQDFIAQARRTRDLWFGSHLLSELARACARSLVDDGAKLIFPALGRDDPALEPCDEPWGPDGKTSAVAIANKILAETDAEPAKQAETARGRVQERWRKIAGRVRSECDAILAHEDQGLCRDLVDNVWWEQVDGALEFYAVWVPRTGSYKADRTAAERALAGRKALRDFRQFEHDLPGRPKSSLDGARVSVLAEAPSHHQLASRGIRRGEQLDAVGLVKRTGFKPERFIPLVNVAAGNWLQRASKGFPDELGNAATSAEKGIQKIDRDLRVIAPFKFDASILYPSRWWPMFEEMAGDVHDRDAERKAARAWGEDNIRPLLKKMKSEPPAYVACLCADGDHMGRAIDSLPDPGTNRAFSRALSDFPQQAREIVEKLHLGALVYSGGDDVLAFLPLATAVACADALARAFAAAMQAAPIAEKPTLSVGIGIQHVMDPMSSLLELARDAEKQAKQRKGKNALAVIMDKRSGGRAGFSLPWDEDPLKRTREDARLLADEAGLSIGRLHALDALLRRFPAADETAGLDPSALAPALWDYASDVLRKTEPDREQPSLADLGIERTKGYAELRETMRNALNRLLIVRELRRAGFNGEEKAQ